MVDEDTLLLAMYFYYQKSVELLDEDFHLDRKEEDHHFHSFHEVQEEGLYVDHSYLHLELVEVELVQGVVVGELLDLDIDPYDAHVVENDELIEVLEDQVVDLFLDQVQDMVSFVDLVLDLELLEEVE